MAKTSSKHTTAPNMPPPPSIDLLPVGVGVGVGVATEEIGNLMMKGILCYCCC
jgi:hypothetical protein